MPKFTRPYRNMLPVRLKSGELQGYKRRVRAYTKYMMEGKKKEKRALKPPRNYDAALHGAPHHSRPDYLSEQYRDERNQALSYAAIRLRSQKGMRVYEVKTGRPMWWNGRQWCYAPGKKNHEL